MSIMPLREVRDHLSEIVHEVATMHERVMITSDGRPTVVIIALDDLDAIEETLDILSTPGALEEIRQAEEELSRGEVIDAHEMLEILRRRQAAEGSPRSSHHLAQACSTYTPGMSIMPLGEFRDHLSEIVDQVETTHERVTITKDGRPAVMLIAVDDFEGLEETLDLMRTPGAVDEIREASTEFERGEYVSAQELLDRYRAGKR